MASREGRLKSTERPRSQGPLLRANGSSSLPMGNWNHSKLPSCGMKRVKLSITCVIFAYHEMLPTYRFTCLSLNTLRLSASIKCLSIRYEQTPHACTCLPVQVSVTTKSAKNRKNISTNIFWRSFDGLSCCRNASFNFVTCSWLLHYFELRYLAHFTCQDRHHSFFIFCRLLTDFAFYVLASLGSTSSLQK